MCCLQRAVGNWVIFLPTTLAASGQTNTLGQLAGGLRSDLHSHITSCVLSAVAYFDWAEQQV